MSKGEKPTYLTDSWAPSRNLIFFNLHFVEFVVLLSCRLAGNPRFAVLRGWLGLLAGCAGLGQAGLVLEWTNLCFVMFFITFVYLCGENLSISCIWIDLGFDFVAKCQGWAVEWTDSCVGMFFVTF